MCRRRPRRRRASAGRSRNDEVGCRAMKLATFRAPGRSQPLAGEVLDDRVVAFAGGAGVADVLAGATPSRGSESWGLSEVTLLAPVPRPGTIYAIGRNYAAHAAEMGNQAPEQPIVFVKV